MRRVIGPFCAVVLIGNFAGAAVIGDNGLMAWGGYYRALEERRAELADLLWLETNAAELNGVTFNKGCFVGQENTARMNWRKKVNRRLFVVPGEQEKARAYHPDCDLSVVHARIDAVPEGALMPDWLAKAIAS